MKPSDTSASTAPKAKSMERALQYLRKLIANGDLFPGEQIRQQEMAESLGLSRVPLREALNVLADQGLLLHKPNQGYFVTKRGPNELAQITRMLQLLEDELLLSLNWPDNDRIALLNRLNDEMRIVSISQDWSPLVRLNREFHLQIYELSPHKLIFEEVKRLWALADLFIATKFSDSASRLQTCKEHDSLIASLLSKDHQACLNVMREHRASTASGLRQSSARAENDALQLFQVL